MDAKRRMPRLHTEQANVIKGLLFISPWILGFLLFGVFPIGSAFYYSLTQYDVVRPAQFIGFGNYAELFFHDKMMGTVTYNTLWWVGIAVPLGIVAAFLMANLLNSDARGRSVYRALAFVPSVVPAVVSATVWQWLLSPRYGLINSVLISAGMKAIPFLTKPELAKPTLTVIHLWAQGGAIVIFLAALQDVPRSLYDAARVDGANGWQQLWHITVPLCTPAALFMLITGIIGGFQSFAFPWLLTGGGPVNATRFYSLYLYENAFQVFRMGYASALAWVLFLLVVVVSIITFRTSTRWVYYGAD